jgi:hypothetical protein
MESIILLSPCYGPNTPFKIPDFATVCICQNGGAVVDMANSFITMKVELSLKITGSYNDNSGAKTGIPSLKTGNCSGVGTYRTLFIGWKNLEAVQQYDIYVSGTKIYPQNWVGEESLIFNAGMSESVRRRN